MTFEKKHTGPLVLGALTAGAVVGAGLAALYGSGTGRQLRKSITRKVQDTKEAADEMLNQAVRHMHHKKANVKSMVQAGKEAVREKRVRRAA